MKKLLDVEKTRSEQHADNQQNSVHRSSLLVPVLPNSEVSISFLNHFLIKRGITSVGCKVTAIDKSGVRLISHLTIIDEPRVYTMYLQRDFNVDATSFLVEFFSSKNIFPISYLPSLTTVEIPNLDSDCLLSYALVN